MKNISGLWRDNMLWHPLTYQVGSGIYKKKRKPKKLEDGLWIMLSVSNDLIQSCEVFKGMCGWGKLEEQPMLLEEVV